MGVGVCVCVHIAKGLNPGVISANSILFFGWFGRQGG